MKSIKRGLLFGVLGLGWLSSAPVLANNLNWTCSLRTLAGDWAFATDVGQQRVLPADGDITALGIFSVDRQGNVTGKFDVTVAEFVHSPAVTFEGTMTVNPDCTGTLNFITSLGTSRTDSIVVLNRYEMWGMSQDILNLWNYQVRRLPRF